MAKNLCFLCAFLITINCSAQTSSSYDSILAKKTGADEYGMKHYVLAILKAGTVKPKDEKEHNDILKGHLKNIQRLATEGKLIVAGPFLDNQELRGIFIFNVSSVEEARALANTDPGIRAGLFSIELHPWYGSAALTEVFSIQKQLQKKNVFDQ